MNESGVERALIAVGEGRIGIIVATDGPWLMSDIQAIACGVEDVGLDAIISPEPGLYVWEGRGKNGGYYCGDGHYEPEREYSGTTRPATWEDVQAILAAHAALKSKDEAIP